jgi:hypothetical protein
LGEIFSAKKHSLKSFYEIKPKICFGRFSVRLLEAFGRFFKLHKSSGHSDSHKEAALR